MPDEIDFDETDDDDNLEVNNDVVTDEEDETVEGGE